MNDQQNNTVVNTKKKNDTWFLIFMGAVAGSIITLALTTGGQHNHRDMSMEDMSRFLERRTGDTFDQAFLEMMIVHHEGAVDMANLALEKAEHEELKSFAQAIITAQTQEIKTMEDWLVTWGYQKESTQ